MENNEESNLDEQMPCKKFTKYDLELYSTILFEIDRGNPVDDEIKDLSSHGHGASLKEIDSKINSHLNSCYACAEYMKEANEGWQLLNIVGKIAFYNNEQRKKYPEFMEINRRFPIEHFEMGNESYKLRDFIRNQIKPSKHDVFSEEEARKYQTHVEKCDFCQEFQGLAKIVLSKKD